MIPARLLVLSRHTLPAAALLFLSIGLFVRVAAESPVIAARIWMIGLAVTGVPVAWKTVAGMFRGRFAADVVALLAVVAAVVLQQPLVGLVIVLMQTGGESLENYAQGRASDAVRELEKLAPRTAHRIVLEGVEDVPAEVVNVGDHLLIRPGDLVPCDCTVLEGRSHIDASRITGEPIPIRAVEGVRLMSGTLNGEGALTVRAEAVSRESQYARIVELVRSAQASKSPLQRTADKYAVWFTPLTIAVCIVTYLVSGDANRVLAVLAVATPCPLILATPVAILGGINRAARRQIIVRHGAALEQVGETTVAVFDKTGTITIGMPLVRRVRTLASFGEDELLRLACAVEERSSHLLARVLVSDSHARGINLPRAADVVESPGRGVVGTVEGHTVLVGAASFARERYPELAADLDGVLRAQGRDVIALTACIVVDGKLAGVVDFADSLRPGVVDLFAGLSKLGYSRLILLSGDHAANAREMADQLGITEVEGDLLPQDKVARVNALVAQGNRVLMVGDGTNDAPALSAATVGVALAGHGGGITAEAADVVLLTDDIARVAEAIQISRRTMTIARQGIRFGLGLSIVGMAGAAFGFIVPVAGALLQEIIDLAVIVNALRASKAAPTSIAATNREPAAARAAA